MDFKETGPLYWDKQYADKKIGVSRKLFARILHYLAGIFYKNPLQRRVQRILANNQIRACLEAGCGTGGFVFYLASHPSVDLSVGIDFSNNAISLAAKSKKLHPDKNKTFFLSGDVRSLPFKDNTFDFVTSLGVIEHFKNPFPLLKEMKRVLKKKGILFLEVPNRKAFGLTERRISVARKTTGFHDFYTPEELSFIVSKSGFKISKTYAYDFAWGVCLYINYATHSAAGVILYPIFRMLNSFMKHQGFFSVVEAKK